MPPCDSTRLSVAVAVTCHPCHKGVPVNGIRNLILAVVLAALATSTASADSHDPVLQAVEAWESIEWFTENCEAGTLPNIPGGYFSTKVEGKGSVGYWGLQRHQLKLFPGKDFALGDPGAISHLYEDRTLGYGVYCVHVEVIKEPVDVKLVCWTQWAECDDSRQLEVTLSTGYSVLWVNEDAMGQGQYRAWFRCADGSRLCWPARVSAKRFVPPSATDICQYLTEGRWC